MVYCEVSALNMTSLYRVYNLGFHSVIVLVILVQFRESCCGGAYDAY